MVQLLSDFIRDEKRDIEIRLWANTYYGSSTKSMYTMFEATLSGCWPNYIRPLLDHSWLYVIIFGVYVVAIVFALIRILTAVFLGETLKNTDKDTEMLVAE